MKWEYKELEPVVIEKDSWFGEILIVLTWLGSLGYVMFGG